MTTVQDTTHALTQARSGQELMTQTQAALQITSTAMPVVANAIGTAMDKKAADLQAQARATTDPDQQQALLAEAARYGEGGIYRDAAHMALGGLGGGVTGALSAGSVAAAAPMLNQLQDALQTQLLSAGMSDNSSKTVAQLLTGGVVAAVGTAAGGSTGAVASLSASFSDAKVTGNFASVTEQSGVKAGDGGFQVAVKGGTTLTGGVVTSNQAAVDGGRNSLSTATLVTSDLRNQDDFKGVAIGVSGYFMMGQGGSAPRSDSTSTGGGGSSTSKPPMTAPQEPLANTPTATSSSTVAYDPSWDNYGETTFTFGGKPADVTIPSGKSSAGTTGGGSVVTVDLGLNVGSGKPVPAILLPDDVGSGPRAPGSPGIGFDGYATPPNPVPNAPGTIRVGNSSLDVHLVDEGGDPGEKHLRDARRRGLPGCAEHEWRHSDLDDARGRSGRHL